VHSLRAQSDKNSYMLTMRKIMENQENLILRQAEVSRLLTEGACVVGVEIAGGARYYSDIVVITSGVYMNSRIITGESSVNSGPSGLRRSELLASGIEEIGIRIMRFKTGTPPRIDGKTADISKMDVQPGDTKPVPFSFMTDPSLLLNIKQQNCYLTWTNLMTKEIIQSNIHRSPMFSGMIDGTGARYCPSIEDKIVRFHEKERHQLFIEPEGLYTNEMYVQGFSTSLPEDVQQRALNTVEGLENARIVRPGYAIEYDCIDSTCLDLSLMSKEINGLFFAGQVCGSSGYEEAAAQGLMAGINAALLFKGEAPLILKRFDAYIGVLIDDLVVKGTPEPYRMMTSRAEYRLILRQDNADFRLTQMGYDAGLAGEERYARYLARKEKVSFGLLAAEKESLSEERLKELEQKYNQSYKKGLSKKDMLKRTEINADDIYKDTLEDDIKNQIEIEIKYEGYIEKQKKSIEKFIKTENKKLPAEIDYNAISGLRLEARQKLNRIKPDNIGQASRISGVSPSDIEVLIVYLTRREKMKKVVSAADD
jgi:tRNA uridine 5-carboxymethylaminomethyl modification enzyme